MKNSKPVQADTRDPLAISYVRFSDPTQRKGDSARRQKTDTEKWCEDHGIPLDKKLSCKDAGRSAYHGRHRSDKAALGQFLELVKEGKVPRGSFLIVENLDRLSREDERTALRLWLDILDAGISIVQLHPETIFRHDKSDMVDIMRAIIELSRGHSESRMKSVRSLANWNQARQRARNGEVITRRLPAWVSVDENGLPILVLELVVVVKRIFEMARSGLGANSIVKRLTAEGVPAFGDRVLVEDPEDGETYWQAAPGERYGCGEWRPSYVRRILKDRRALGEFQPRDSSGKKLGDAIAGYFPPAVSAEQFYAARAAVVGRTNGEANRQGRIGEGVANLFGGLLRHARDGETYYVGCRSENGVRSRVLLNRSSIEPVAGGPKERKRTARAYTFSYEVFERCILSRLREIDPAEIIEEVPITEVSVLQGELNELRERKAALALELLKGDIASIADVLRQLEARETELLAKIDDNAERTVAPRSDAWGTMHSLLDVLDGATEEEREDIRLRLRAAIRRCVDLVYVLVVPRGRSRFVAVQIYFTEGGRRNYLIWRKPELGHAALGTKRGRVPEQLHVLSFADVALPDDLDLRRKEDVADLERVLGGLELSAGAE